MARKSVAQIALEKAAARIFELERTADERDHRIFDLEKRIAERDDRDALKIRLDAADADDKTLRGFCEHVDKMLLPPDAVLTAAIEKDGMITSFALPISYLRGIATRIRAGAVLREFHPKLRTAAFPGARQT